MRKYLLILTILIIWINVSFAEDTMIVKNLIVENNPNDDGSGLIVKFEPLPKTAKIIEYRIYRGLSPDSLFYLGKIEVDPKTGFSGNEITFFDKDFRPFVDIESPKKLRKEVGQQKNSPIYRALPRDLNIIGPMLDKFSLLAIIYKNNFYKKTTKHIIESENSRDLFGGLRVEDFDAIVANVLPGRKYYYSVIAVDERRNFHQHAPAVYGIASDNIPNPSEKFYAVWLQDTKILNFEFELPLFVDDIAKHLIYMIPKSELHNLEIYKTYMSELDIWNKNFTEGDTLTTFDKQVENPGRIISVIESSFPYTSLNFSSVKYENGFLYNEYDKTEIPFDYNKIDDYYFYLSLADYQGFEAISTPVQAKIADSSQLPFLPIFEVRDKPHDKGDVNEVIIGRPYAALTQLNYRGRGTDRRKLSVAYTYSPNPNFKVNSIKFDFVDINGKIFKSITEHYFDYLFNFDLPSLDYLETGFKVFITFNAPGTIIHQKNFLSQSINFDDDLMQLRPGNLYAEDEELLSYRYQIVKKSIADKNFRIANKITPLTNLYEDIVSYEKYIFKGISSYDLKKGHLLFDSSIDLGYDANSESYISTNLFLTDFIDISQEKLSYYNTLLQDNPDDEEAFWYINFINKNIENQREHPFLKDINEIGNNRKRISELAKLREKNRRSFKYFLVKTDSEGLFTLSDIYIDKNGNEYIFPTPEWFSIKAIPMLIASIVFGFFVFYFYQITRTGKELFIRPIAGLEEIDNAIGRATEMGRPILFVPGLSSIGDVATLAGLSILGHITKKAAEYDTRIIVPVCDYIVLPIAQQIVKESHYAAGRPDSYNSNDIFFVAEGQFAYVAGVNGVMIRQKTATNFYMGMFYAEALIMTETGNATGAIQVAGTDALTQIPFFITTCDYTLIGEELYAASAYLTRDPMMIGTLKAQDYTKLLIILFIIIGTILSSVNITFFINWFPAE